LKQDTTTRLYGICIIIDDMVDDASFTRNSRLLHQLYIRGRHSCITTLVSSQVYEAMSPIIRKNLSAIFIYRLRNMNDLQQLIEEMSTIYDQSAWCNYIKQQLMNDMVFYILIY